MLVAGRIVARALARAGGRYVLSLVGRVAKGRAAGWLGRVAGATAEAAVLDWALEELLGYGISDLAGIALDKAVHEAQIRWDALVSGWGGPEAPADYVDELVHRIGEGRAGRQFLLILDILNSGAMPLIPVDGGVGASAVGLPFQPGPGESLWAWARRVAKLGYLTASEARVALLGFDPGDLDPAAIDI